MARRASAALARARAAAPAARALASASASATAAGGGRGAGGGSPPCCLVLSNDDGVEAPGLLAAARALRQSTGLRVVVVAPDRDRSGAGMALTLRRGMPLAERPDLGPDTYSVGGTPADCALCALEPGVGLVAALGLAPALAVSGLNAGPNLGFDVLFSGTVGAARTASMFGVPSVAASLASASAPHDFAGAAAGLGELVDALLRGLGPASGADPAPAPAPGYPRPDRAPGGAERRYATGGFELQRLSGVTPAESDAEAAAARRLLGAAFRRADVFLNVNVPPGWELSSGGAFAPAGLGVSQYRGTLKVAGADGQVLEDPPPRQPGGPLPAAYFTGSGEYLVDPAAGCDITTVKSGRAAVSTLQTWPEGHALCLSEEAMAAAAEPAADPAAQGLPAWIADLAARPS